MAVRITDNFNGANQTPIAGNWTTITGESSTLDRSSNTVIAHDVTLDAATYNLADTPPPDQYCEIEISVTGGTGGAGLGLACRVSTSARTYYRLIVGSTGQWEILKWVSGTLTVLSSGTFGSWSSGGKVRLSCQGSTIFGTYLGVDFGSVSDGAITSGRYGMAHSSTSTGGSMDNWTGGDFAPNASPDYELIYKVPPSYRNEIAI